MPQLSRKTKPVARYAVQDSAKLFELAFGQDEAVKNFKPDPVVDYELDTKVGTDPGHLHHLDALMKDGVQYRDLPLGLRKLVKPKRPLAKELRQQEDATGRTLEERQAIFDAFQFNIDYLSSLAEAGLPVNIIANEYDQLKTKYPVDQIELSLQEVNQQLLAKLKAEEKAAEYDNQKAAAQARSESSQEALRNELKAAKQLLEMQGQKATDNNVRDALLRNQAIEARQAGDE